jgi:hypothetical protein
VTGLIYPSGSPDALAGELLKLLADRDFLTRLRVNGSERVKGYGSEMFARRMVSAARMSLGKAKAELG